MDHDRYLSIVTLATGTLHTNRAFVDLSHRGRIQATGDDRARLLHALTTNHVQQMQSDDRIYCFFLTAQGRVLSDAILTCEEERFIIDIEPEAREALLKHIEHYIIADDVTLEDITGSTFCLLAGTKRIYGDIAKKEEVIAGLGLAEASVDDWRTFRLENFSPRFGEDFTLATLPQETGLAGDALHFQKGCYIGQEIVERIHSRGHVNKTLVGLQIFDGEIPAPGTKVSFEGAEVGEVTSAAASPHFGDIRAIAMVRVQAAKPGTTVQVAEQAALVSAVRSVIALGR